MGPDDDLADVLMRLGGIPRHRVVLQPSPGTATEQDWLARHEGARRLCELIDGVLVDKSYHFRESVLNVALTSHLLGYEEEVNLGFPIGPSAAYRVAAGRVRSPDVSFFHWDRVPGRRVPDVVVADFPPALTVELNNEGNTATETALKVRDDFASGVRLVWAIDIDTRTVDVYASPDTFIRLDESQTLDGGDVLPGFTLSIRQWFERVARSG